MINNNNLPDFFMILKKQFFDSEMKCNNKSLFQIFIGAIDYNMQEDEFIEEVKSWGNIIKVYYRGPTSGWGTATFSSPEERTKFLARKRWQFNQGAVQKLRNRMVYQHRGVLRQGIEALH